MGINQLLNDLDEKRTPVINKTLDYDQCMMEKKTDAYLLLSLWHVDTFTV